MNNQNQNSNKAILIPFKKQDYGCKFGNETCLFKDYQKKLQNKLIIAPYSQDCYFNFRDLEKEMEIRERV